jgi:MtfA peptidase
MTLAANASDFLVALIAAILAVWFLRGRYLKRRRERLPFPNEWRSLMRARMPLLALLKPEQRVLHERRTREFLADVRFIGCNGLSVTDEMRVLIAGLACLLVLRPDAHVFRSLHAVLIYPSAFWVRHQQPDELGLVSDSPQLRMGESWNGQRVVLSWEDVQAALNGAPHNVVVHEFAHQLDDENPGSPGAPKLADYGQWSKVMRAEFDRLHEHPSVVLDDYGLEGPQEFFAVATEAYFQSGAELQREHPRLYALLRDYYSIDTARLLV